MCLKSLNSECHLSNAAVYWVLSKRLSLCACTGHDGGVHENAADDTDEEFIVEDDTGEAGN